MIYLAVLVTGALSFYWLNREIHNLEMPRFSPWLSYFLFIWFVIQMVRSW